MSLIKDPSGSFYLESDQFNVDYEENSIKFVGESGKGATYTAGEGITISGNTISVVYGNIVPGCKITVTKGEEQIEPFAEANNIFPLDEIDGEYTVNVSASGYVAQEVQVTADEDQILTITLAQE